MEKNFFFASLQRQGKTEIDDGYCIRQDKRDSNTQQTDHKTNTTLSIKT